jgi:threonine dehydrogenase-like Zn-dependent dehydrogenase
MRQLTFFRPGELEWRDVPEPRLSGPGEAIVRPIVVGRCDLDTGYVRGTVPLAAGNAIGHECIAEVVDLSDHASSFTIGQRVIVSPQISCGTCAFCRRGLTGRCSSVPFAASYGMGREGGYGGAASDLVRVPYAEAMLVPLPVGSDPVKMIGAADAALDAWRSVGPYLRERPGCAVLVAGGWPSRIGIYAAGIAVALGAARVDYVDTDDERLTMARRFGANALKLPLDLEPIYGIVVDSCGNAGVLRQAIRATEPEGVITSCTIHRGDATPLPLQEMYWKGIIFRTGRPNVRSQIEPVLNLCAKGFDPSVLQTLVAPFDDAPEAFLDAAVSVAVSRA